MKPSESLVVQDSGRLETQADVNEYRKQQFLALGFNDDWAGFLALAKESALVRDRKGTQRRYETPLYHGTVEKLLAKGLSHDEVCKLYC